MRLLQRNENGDFILTKDLVGDDPIPPYAILSHTWGPDNEEFTFEDITNGTGKDKHGYEKIQFCGEQARQDGLEYFWIDTCCINKKNQAELSHAINSMFRWYRSATRCYVYMSDVSTLPPLENSDEHSLQPWELGYQKSSWFIWEWTLQAVGSILRWYRDASPSYNSSNATGRPVDTSDECIPPPWESHFRKSRWFTRGWTLQELLAPVSVEFFSRERKLLGDKRSLTQKVHEITGIPLSALHGDSLSQFSVNERMSWINPRQTKLEEDRAYSLLGIFGVYIPPRYGEGMTSAFNRLQEEIEKLGKCLRDLRLSDPCHDKKRIEDDKGGLLEGSYQWILKNSEYQQWRSDGHSRLLWIKGDPGKGKTMLLCGIINELKKSIARSDLLLYFFCQAADSRINHATAVLRGLIYMLIDQQPSLISHIQKKYSQAGKTLFEDANAWVALSEAFSNILQDPNIYNTFLIIDALDECIEGLPKLLGFIIQILSVSPRVKWIVSSRNWPNIKQDLDRVTQKVIISLEINECSVSAAVATFIKFKVNWLAERKRYDNGTQDAVQQYLSQNAKGTFLWVALICQELSNTPRWKALEKLPTFPPGLNALYQRIIDQIMDSEDAELCKRILAVVLAVYRPVTLDELTSSVDLPNGVAGDYEALSEIIGLCDSFLTLKEYTISFVHQSAKDFLIEKAYSEIYPSGIEYVHQSIFSRSLQIMSKTLRRDIYGLDTPGISINQVQQPNPNPLSSLQYSCVYWIDHLLDYDLTRHATTELQDGGSVDKFLCQNYLYWLEALSLCRSMSKGVVSMAKLEALLHVRADGSGLFNLVKDASRFVMYHKLAIENSPLQAYSSALLFSPSRSLIRRLFRHKEPKSIIIQPAMAAEWSSCLQTLEGHSRFVFSAAFSHNSTRLASASGDRTVKIWDTSSGACLQTLKGHSDHVFSVAFSHNSTQLASASGDRTVKIWDTSSGTCLHTLKGHSDHVFSVAFSHNSTRLASASGDRTVKIWNASSGTCFQTLEGHSYPIFLVAFSHDSAWLASASNDSIVKIWDTSSGACLQTLEGHSGPVRSVAFSHDSTWLTSASGDRTAKIWDTSSGACLQTLKGHGGPVLSAAFSHDSTRLASASGDRTVKIWDSSSGACVQTLEGHGGPVFSVAFSHESTRLASASNDRTVKIWDTSSSAYLQTLEGHGGPVFSMAFSHDSTRLASASYDRTVKIWDTRNGACVQTLKGHSDQILSVAFSHESIQLASASDDRTVKIWDTSSGACLQTLKGHSDRVLSVAFSHNSTRLASALNDSIVKIWDTSSGACLQTLEGHSGPVRSVAFSHDSSWLVSVSDDKTVKIWDTNSGACLQTLEGHSGPVRSVAFSHDSAWLASASGDRTAKIWDTNSGDCLQTLEVGKPLRSILFDATGSRLRTDIGTIALRVSSASLARGSKENLQCPQYEGIGLSLDGAWITYNSEKVLWLPSDYRPYCSVVCANTVVIGVGSGVVWTCTFNPKNDKLPMS